MTATIPDADADRLAMKGRTVTHMIYDLAADAIAVRDQHRLQIDALKEGAEHQAMIIRVARVDMASAIKRAADAEALVLAHEARIELLRAELAEVLAGPKVLAGTCAHGQTVDEICGLCVSSFAANGGAG